MSKFLATALLFVSCYCYTGNLEVIYEKNFSGSHSEIDITIKDVNTLLNQYQNKLTESIRFTIHLNKTLEAETIKSKVKYPQHNYELHYSFNQKENHADLKVDSRSFEGLVFGLYGFLQEKLEIKFYHPKKTQIPNPLTWPLTSSFDLKVKPKFQLKGFHLHTLHPIELTEYLMDPEWGEEGQKEVKAYIDWLVRNGQNYFQFYLLESVKLKKWTPYFKEIANYARDRGLMLGISLSLHSIQEKAYMLYNNWPASWLKKKKQITKRIAKLNEIKWDYWSMDFKKNEFSEKKLEKINELKLHVFNELKKHSVKLGEYYGDHNQFEDLGIAGDSSSNDFINNIVGQAQTAMFYSLTDEKNPIYKEEDFSHVLPLKNSNTERETWYFPESAFWGTFDNSIPMMLTPYLKARLKDIDLCHKKKVDGHLTSSSGWEWGYEMIDWSIARWSWDYKEESHELQYVNQFFPTRDQKEIVEKLVNLQQEFIKDSNLIEFLTAQSPTDGLPTWIYNKDAYPRPPFSYKHLRNKANKEELDYAEHKIFLLKKFAHKTANLVYELRESKLIPEAKEITDGFEITGLRADHKAYVMEYLVEKRAFYFDRNRSDHILDSLLYLAQCAREDAQVIVSERKLIYRYPNIIIGSKYKGKTAYPFGYLYPVENLHFWRREELQAKKNKYRVGYKNIYPLLKIAGIIN